MFIGHNFWKQSDPEKINYADFLTAIKDKIRDNEKDALKNRKPVDSKELDAALN